MAEPDPRFFTAPQFAALRRLSDLLMPAMRGNLGALDTAAPEFLDFLIGVSPVDRQQLYRNGLDTLNARAHKQFGKGFADLDAEAGRCGDSSAAGAGAKYGRMSLPRILCNIS